MSRAWVLIAALFVPVLASGEAPCLDQLGQMGVVFERTRARGVDSAVRIKGDLGGVEYRSYSGKALLIGCPLALALARSGRFLLQHDLVSATYSSALSRRRIRKSGRWSQHAFGLAIDIHSFKTKSGEVITVRSDFEQGLGDQLDCIGKPLTRHGAVLRTLACQFRRSGFFKNVLDPDYDGHHHNHFHLDVKK